MLENIVEETCGTGLIDSFKNMGESSTNENNLLFQIWKKFKMSTSAVDSINNSGPTDMLVMVADDLDSGVSGTNSIHIASENGFASPSIIQGAIDDKATATTSSFPEVFPDTIFDAVSEPTSIVHADTSCSSSTSDLRSSLTPKETIVNSARVNVPSVPISLTSAPSSFPGCSTNFLDVSPVPDTSASSLVHRDVKKRISIISSEAYIEEKSKRLECKKKKLEISCLKKIQRKQGKQAKVIVKKKKKRRPLMYGSSTSGDSDYVP